MVTIIKAYQEIQPDVKLVGKRYPQAQREPAKYTKYWEEWFIKDWFAPLQALGGVGREEDSAYIGSMRWNGDELEYWIGMFVRPDAPVPEGYEALDIPSGKIGVLWVKGPDDWGLYKLHEECVELCGQQGWQIGERADFFERYTQSRFVKPDDDGTVILDYCVHLPNRDS